MAAAKGKGGKDQRRDPKGRFASGPGGPRKKGDTMSRTTESERGRAFTLRNAAIAAGLATAVGGAVYFARKGATGKEAPSEMISRASSGTATTNLGNGAGSTSRGITAWWR